jgi:hypothetical protein
MILSILQVFSIVLLVVSILTTIVSMYVFGIHRSPGSEPEFFHKQNNVCKIGIAVLLGLGWLFGNPAEIGSFAQVYQYIGFAWFFFGIAYMLFMIFGLFTNASKTVLEQLRKFGFGDLIFGIVITSVTWVFWGK